MSAGKRQFPLALETHLELKTDMPSLRSVPMPAPPTLGTLLAGIGPLPRGALFLGVASDGLPVLLNLHDPAPGPLLVVGEAGAGKTALLKSIVHSLTHTHKPDDLQYGVLTDHIDEWDSMENTKHRVGMFSPDQKNAQKFMLSLAAWAHANKSSRQSVLLLIDGIEPVAKLDFDALHSFRWLLARGPSRHVWPIVTLNADRYGQVFSWIPIFRSRIFGRIRNAGAAEVLSSDKASGLDQLEVPFQFSMRENENWVKFWLPSF